MLIVSTRTYTFSPVCVALPQNKEVVSMTSEYSQDGVSVCCCYDYKKKKKNKTKNKITTAEVHDVLRLERNVLPMSHRTKVPKR